jgi:hypothetical protein
MTTGNVNKYIQGFGSVKFHTVAFGYRSTSNARREAYDNILLELVKIGIEQVNIFL